MRVSTLLHRRPDRRFSVYIHFTCPVSLWWCMYTPSVCRSSVCTRHRCFTGLLDICTPNQLRSGVCTPQLLSLPRVSVHFKCSTHEWPFISTVPFSSRLQLQAPLIRLSVHHKDSSLKGVHISKAGRLSQLSPHAVCAPPSLLFACEVFLLLLSHHLLLRFTSTLSSVSLLPLVSPCTHAPSF